MKLWSAVCKVGGEGVLQDNFVNRDDFMWIGHHIVGASDEGLTLETSAL